MNHFRFDISKYSGYRLKVEQSNLSHYKKLKYNGFIISVSSPYYIEFDIDNQLIRRLKLEKLNDNIRKNSKEDILLELLEKSNVNDNVARILPYSLTCATGYYDYEDSEIGFNKEQMKERNNYQSRIYNQKIKQNGFRFRK